MVLGGDKVNDYLQYRFLAVLTKAGYDLLDDLMLKATGYHEDSPWSSLVVMRSMIACIIRPSLLS